MKIIQEILAFLVVISVLITFHELGHYVVARLCGVRVLRFCLGIGKPLVIRKFGKSETEWVLAAIPLGGYVKMLDSRELDGAPMSAQDLAEDFQSKSVWKRIAIVAAGPIANFLLAILVFSGLMMHGVSDPIAKLRIAKDDTIAYQAGLRQGDLVRSVNGTEVRSWSEMRGKIRDSGLEKQDPTLTISRKNPNREGSFDQFDVRLPLSKLALEDFDGDFLAKIGFGYFRPPAILLDVTENGPAGRAGLQAGDQIIAVNEKPILDSLELVEIIRASPNVPLLLLVNGSAQQFEASVTPEAKDENGKTIGLIQVRPEFALEMTSLTYSPMEALGLASTRTWDSSILTLKMLGKMLTGEISWKNLTGPITIAEVAGKAAQISVFFYLEILALISISLGVMNLLPIPVLDGGHLLYYSLEVLIGKPIPEKYVEMAQRGGLAVLLCLMVVAFFNDIVRRMS